MPTTEKLIDPKIIKEVEKKESGKKNEEIVSESFYSLNSILIKIKLKLLKEFKIGSFIRRKSIQRIYNQFTS